MLFMPVRRGVVTDVPKRLADHVAHLFTRDPLVIFKERVEVDDTKTTEHFEVNVRLQFERVACTVFFLSRLRCLALQNFQSTNWQSVRWKPPPANTDMGWRVELRTMETQFTDFENAAFAVFTALINRVIMFFDLNMYMPISLVRAVWVVNRNTGVARLTSSCAFVVLHRSMRTCAVLIFETQLLNKSSTSASLCHPCLVRCLARPVAFIAL